MSTITPNVDKPRYLTDSQRLAISALVASGKTQVDVAKEFGVSSMTVSRIMREVKSVSNQTLGDWRASQAHKAIAAVNAGLDDKSESYKRATIGVQVLKGLGVYAADSVNQIGVIVQAMPADMRAELESSSKSDATDLPYPVE